jgi:hypothetical protein
MFSAQTYRYFNGTTSFGHLEAPTHQSLVGSVEQGHYFQLQLVVDENHVVRALAFHCPLCVPAIACGGYLYERLVGRRADQELTVEQVVRDLGGLPPQRCFYAWMAVEAVRLALV